MITSNEETLNRLKAGDESVFDAVYKQYYKGLCAFASQYVAETETEEIVQEVMMWLWENRAMLVPQMSLKYNPQSNQTTGTRKVVCQI